MQSLCTKTQQGAAKQHSEGTASAAQRTKGAASTAQSLKKAMDAGGETGFAPLSVANCSWHSRELKLEVGSWRKLEVGWLLACC